MYAIIETGGKQYRVQQGDVIDVERLETDEAGKISFTDVLFLHTGSDVKVGAPTVASHVVLGELIEDVKGIKTICFKYKQRKNQYRKKGHRQIYSRVRITAIQEA